MDIDALTSAIRAGKANRGYHLDYITFLGERRRWLAGDHISRVRRGHANLRSRLAR